MVGHEAADRLYTLSLALFTTLTRTGTLNAPQSETFENHTLLPNVDSTPVRKPMGIGIRTVTIM